MPRGAKRSADAASTTASGFQWAIPLTTADPLSKRRKLLRARASHRPAAKDWQNRKTQIEELWKEHELPDVQRILESEGFIASESQIRHHIDKWRSAKKNITLTDKQISYILRRLQKRSTGVDKTATAFKYKANNVVLPSNKIQRTISRKISSGVIRFVSPSPSCPSRLSTPGLRGYTPRLSTPGLLLDTVPDDDGNLIARKVSLLEPAAWQTDLFRNLQGSHPDSRLHFYHNSSPSENPADSAFRIICDDCQSSGQEPVESRFGEGFKAYLCRYERDHLLSQTHLGWVSLRMLDYPNPWEGRAEFIREHQMTCPHLPNVVSIGLEEPSCWKPGGCRWAQFRTIEESIAVNHGEAFAGSEVPDLTTLLTEPIPDLGEFEFEIANLEDRMDEDTVVKQEERETSVDWQQWLREWSPTNNLQVPAGVANWGRHILDDCPASSFFIGREDQISKIHNDLQASHRVIIFGMSGIGKSQLAKQYITSYQGRYQLTFWVDCGSMASFQKYVHKLFWALDLEDCARDRPDEDKMIMVSRALQDTDNSWLLVLDHCVPATVDAIISFLPQNKGDVIVTANDGEVGGRFTHEVRRDGASMPKLTTLEDLSREESLDLLLHGLSDEEKSREERAASQIFDRIQGHPLALRVMQGITKGTIPSLSYEETLCRMDLATGTNHPLLANKGSLSLSNVIMTDLSMMSPAAQWMLHILSFFNSKKIPDFLLSFEHLNGDVFEKGNVSDKDCPGEGAASLADLRKPGQVELCLKESEQRGLVRREIVRVGRRQKYHVSTHPVVAQVVRALFQERQERALHIAIDLCNAALPDYEEGYLKLLDWQDGEEIQNHVASLVLISKEEGLPADPCLNLLYRIALRKFLVEGDRNGALEIIVVVLGNLAGPLRERTDCELAFAILFCRITTTVCFFTTAYADGSLNEHARPWEAQLIEAVLQESLQRYGSDDIRTVKLGSYLATAVSANSPTYSNLHRAFLIRNGVIKQMEKMYGSEDMRTVLEYTKLACDQARNKKTEDVDADEISFTFSAIMTRLRAIPGADLEGHPDVLYQIAWIYYYRGEFVEMNNFAARALRSIRGHVSQRLISPSHLHVVWCVVMFMRSLFELKQWLQLSLFLQEEPLFEGFSGRNFHIWTRQPEHFERIYTPDFFYALYASDGHIGEIVESANIMSYWVLGDTGSSEPFPEPPYPLLDVADFLDTKNWEDTETLVETLMGYNSRGSEPNSNQSESFQGQIEVGKGIHALIWAILGRACSFNLDEDHDRKLGPSLKAKRRTSYDRLNQYFVNIWIRLWHRIDSCSYKVNIDNTRMPDPFFGTPGECSTYILRVVLLGSVEGTKLVLKREPNLHLQNPEGKTVFYYAAEHHHYFILILLLEATAKNPQFLFGCTSLIHLLCVPTWQTHDTAEEDQAGAVAELLKRGHKPNCVDANGQTPLDLAKLHGLRDIERELTRHQELYGWSNLQYKPKV